MSSHRMLNRCLDENVGYSEITDIADIGQNRDFGQNLEISLVLRVINHYKRFLLRLRFV